MGCHMKEISTEKQIYVQWNSFHKTGIQQLDELPWEAVLSIVVVFKTFFYVYFWERESVSGVGAEREGDTEPKTALGSELSAQSLMRGSNPQTMRSWPEPKLDA